MLFGQTKIRESIDILCDAAQKKNGILPHILFVGPSGYGKTSFAKYLAAQFKTQLEQINAASVRKPRDIEEKLTLLKCGDIFFIDEIHRLSIALQEILYTAMDEGYITQTMYGIPIGRRNLQKFTLVGATTHTVSAPLRSRFQHTFHFNEYTQAELEQIIKCESDKIQVNIPTHELVQYVRGNPREAINKVHWLKDYSTSKKLTITPDVLTKSMAQLGIHKYGLNGTDLAYLRYLSAQSLPVGIKTISGAINIPTQTLEDSVEPYLCKLQLIFKTGQGRIANLERLRDEKII